MTRKIEKIIFILIILFIIFSLFSNIYATDLKTTLNVIQSASETKYLENDQGYISKTIVDSNPNTGEVTIELKVSNSKKQTSTSNDTEIVFVIDNSPSMKFTTAAGETRKHIVLTSAKSLVNSVYSTSSNVKMGIVKFSGESGLFAPLNAASVITELTTDKEEILEGLTNIETKYYSESGTNIQKGLIKGKELFSENAGHKILILLTDGCPNEDNEGNHVGNSGMVMTNETYLKILENTKNELVKTSQSGITLISLMTGINSGDLDGDGNIITDTEDDLQAVETIFGSESNPTAGKFYNAKTTDVSNIIENNITSDITKVLNTPINNTKIVDYFPSDITDNFEFSYVGNPSIGTTSESIDKTTNTITWDIGTLRGDEEATLRYKLKIKDMNNSKLLNKTISTNEKVVLTYTDTSEKDYTVTLTSSPQIQLAEVKEETNTSGSDSDNSKDTTIAKGSLPKAGISIGLILSTLFLIAFGIFVYKKFIELKDVK